MTTDNKLPVHELSDVEVLTVGLVTHGANREDFFLRKEASPMPNDTDLLLEDTPKEAPSWVAKLREWIKGDVAEEIAKAKSCDPKAVEAMRKASKILAAANCEMPDEAKKLMAKVKAMEDEGYGYPEPGAEEEPTSKKVKKADTSETPDEEPKDVEKAKKPFPPEAENPEEEAQPKEEKDKMKKDENVAKSAEVTIPPELTAKLEALEKSQTDLVAELQKARDAEFRAAYIQKAADLVAVPASVDEIAEHLMAVAKADPQAADWWHSLLSAVDHQLVSAGFFAEKGATNPQDKTLLDSIAKSGTNVRDALINMPAAEAQAYLNERRHRARVG